MSEGGEPRAPGEALLDLVVTPRAATNAVGPYVDGVLRVRVTRPPTDGAANAAVARLVARALGIGPLRVVLLSGVSSRRKRVRVVGLSTKEMVRRLTAATG